MNRMLMGLLVTLALMVGATSSAVAVDPATNGSAGAKKSRIVVQVSDNDTAKWNLALNNASNLQKDLGPGNVDIEIVAYGPGIGMLKADSVAANRVSDAMAAGVQVVACENTMQAQKLSKGDMIANVGYVKAGVVEIMQKQQEGWAYLRP